MSKPLTIPTAEPFFFPGGKTGCLLVHGFTGSPKEMRWMGEYLSEQGHTVLGIRLFAHATRPSDMLRARWHDWLASVEDGLNILAGACEQTFIMGLSMGGILTLLAAARYPVAGAVAMSTPYELPRDWRMKYIRLLHHLLPYVGKGGSDWQDPAAAADHVDYPAHPTHGVAELIDLTAEMRTALPDIRVPVLLMHSKKDGGIAPENMPRIYEKLGSPDKQMLWIENSGHVITRDKDRQVVFKAAADFIKRVNQAQ
jgi:carboxylesterase